MTTHCNQWFAYWAARELGLCLKLNHGCNKPLIKQFFSVISRLGNGVFWYSLILVLPLIYGVDALMISVQMTISGLIGLAIYKSIKAVTLRERPYYLHSNIQLGTAPLDRYSFPSGHTLHAFNFTLIAIYHYPELSFLLIPFMLLVAVSRVVLGLHYPTDVICGAILGSLVAATSLVLV
ncbi:MAG: phosphatase PAP2 family protein [Gammaproteobacteria bacterium]|nr:phosphatase PAP2 family protein [Gammaproteobacteria bacterium]